MKPKHADLQDREAFKVSAKKFFSAGKLSDKIKQAEELARLPEANSFLTALPWSLELSPENKIDGQSETFALALKDIQAHLVSLEKVLSGDAQITPKIDEKRLARTVKKALQLKHFDRG